MKVELSIADDSELRQHIRDTIKGEVVSVARAEIKKIIAEVVKEGIVPKSQDDIDKIVRGVVKEEVIQQLTQYNYGENSIKKIAREEINVLLREMIKGQNII